MPSAANLSEDEKLMSIQEALDYIEEWKGVRLPQTTFTKYFRTGRRIGSETVLVEATRFPNGRWYCSRRAVRQFFDRCDELGRNLRRPIRPGDVSDADRRAFKEMGAV